MQEFLTLPGTLRIVLFSFAMLSCAILLFCIPLSVLGKKSRLYSLCLFTLFASIVIISITRTPLFYQQNVRAAEIANYFLVLPLLLTMIYGWVSRKPKFIADGLWFAFNLPAFAFVPYYGYLAGASFVYILIRSLQELLLCLNDVSRRPGMLSIKYALDSIDDGIAFVNLFGQIIYINNSLKKTLLALGATSFQRWDKLLSFLRSVALDKGRIVSDSLFIVPCEGRWHKIVFDRHHNQITCVDVTEEEKLMEEYENTYSALQKMNDDLNDALKTVETMQQEKELLRIKGHLHDNLAQRLSILHMFLLKEENTDLREIKSMLTSLDLPQEDIPSSSDIDDFVSILSSIGVTMTISGDLPSPIPPPSPSPPSFLSTTNSLPAFCHLICLDNCLRLNLPN